MDKEYTLLLQNCLIDSLGEKLIEQLISLQDVQLKLLQIKESSFDLMTNPTFAMKTKLIQV